MESFEHLLGDIQSGYPYLIKIWDGACVLRNNQISRIKNYEKSKLNIQKLSRVKYIEFLFNFITQRRPTNCAKAVPSQVNRDSSKPGHQWVKSQGPGAGIPVKRRRKVNISHVEI